MFKKQIKRGMILIPPLVILLSFTLQAEASSFSHTHNDNCYEVQEVTCSNHYITSFSVGSTKHCPVCLVQQPHSVTGYSDVCPEGIVESRLLGYLISCQVCGNLLQNDSIRLNPAHTYSKRVLKCGIEEGSNLGTVSVSKSSDNWTNGKVTLTVSVTGLSSTLSLASSPYNFGNGYTSSDSFDAETNGTYSVTVRTSDGSTASASVTVSNIDRTPPQVTLTKSTEEWTESGLRVSVSATDSESGISGAAYSFDGGAYGAESSVFVDTNRTVTVSVRDNAGNISTGNITISNIGRDPKVVEAERAEQEAREKAEREAREKEEREAKEKAEQEAKKNQQTAPSYSSGSTSNNTSGNKTNVKQDNSSGKNKNSETVTSTDKTTKEKQSEKKEESEESDDNAPAYTKDGVTVNPGKAGTISGLVSVNDMTGEKSNGKSTDNNPQPDTGNAGNGSTEGLISIEGAESSVGAVSDGDSATMLKKDNGSPAGTITLFLGALSLLIGILMLLNVNYVYKSDKGRIKLVSRVKVKRQGKRVIVYVSEKKLQKGGRYMIYFSPVNRTIIRKKRVYVMISETESLINTDEGTGFTY